MYKPEGYPSVSPYLTVNGAAETIACLEWVFGATGIRRFASEDGRIVHAEVRIEDSVVMLGEAPDGAAVPAHVHVYVSDVDAAYNRALEAGAESVQAPIQEDDPDKRGGVRVPGVTTWWMGMLVG